MLSRSSVLIYQHSAANYYVTVQQSVKSASAREILRKAISGLKREEEGTDSAKPNNTQMDVDALCAKDDSGSTVFMSVISEHEGLRMMMTRGCPCDAHPASHNQTKSVLFQKSVEALSTHPYYNDPNTTF